MSVTRAKKKLTRHTLQLRETAGGVGAIPGDQKRVDRERGRIRNVRVIGQISDNNRRYTPEALRRAIPLYQRAKVKFNHPAHPEDSRPVSDTFGWLENVHQGSDGALYGDLCFLKTHSDAAFVCEIAERNPSLLGLSHNASGQGEMRDGVFVIEQIEDVISVDLVDEPATNSSLFEQRKKPMKKTLRKRLKEAAKVVPTALSARYKKFLEDAMGDDAPEVVDEEMDAPAEEGDWKQCLTDAVGKLAGTDGHEMAKKILAMLAPEKPVEEEDDSETDDVEEETEEPEEEPKKEKADESRKPRRAKPGEAVAHRLQERLNVSEMVADEGLTFATPTRRKAFIESLIPLSATDRKALVEERKQLGAGSPLTDKKFPRSQAVGQTKAVPERKVATDRKSFVEAIKG